jgi:hypothetical protein
MYTFICEIEGKVHQAYTTLNTVELSKDPKSLLLLLLLLLLLFNNQKKKTCI